MADFTAGPLQSLLSSVDQEQRLLYITQLKIQYDACSSESDRFGILKLLLPTVAAVDDSAIAQEILKPIVLESFQVDSMISTESIALIVATLAQRIAGALNNNQSDFSIDLLQLLLCDLVSAMQTEIDLVELDPFGYIDLHLTNSEEWNTIKAKSTRDDQIGQLDLECCMDTLGQIILYAQTGNPWIEIITLIGVALMSCTEQTLRSKATNDIIAAVYERQTNIEKKVEICQMLWDRIMAMFNLPATNLMRVEVYGLTAKFFDYYFEIDNTTEQPLKDLRVDEGFWKLIQAGLRSKDSIARKYSVYILKRVIDVSLKITNSDAIQWTRYFQWEDAKSQEYQYLYEDLFLLYDIMHENVAHLVDPILPRLETLMTGSGLALDPSWWTLLLYRGFQNEAISVRKKILEYVLNLDRPASLLVVAKRPEFLFGVFFGAIDTSSLYTVQTLGTMISPFGEMLRKFIRNLIQCLDDSTEKADLIRQLIHHIAFVMTSFIPIIYIAEALTDIDPCAAFGSVELKSIRVLVDRNRSFQKQNAKIWIRRLCIQAIAQLSNIQNLTFSDVAKTINSLIDGYSIANDTLEYNYLVKLIKDFELEKDVKADVLLAERVVAFLKDPFSEDDIMESVKKQADVISRASLFMPHPEIQFASIISKLREMQSDDEQPSTGYLNKIVILLTTVWNEYTNLKKGEDMEFTSRIGLDSDLSAQLVQWLDSLYLVDGQPAVIVHSIGHLYVALTKHILMSNTLTGSSFRTDTASRYIQNSFDGIKGGGENSLDQETLKMNYLLVAEMSFNLATDMELKGVVSDSKSLVDMISSSRLKRTPDFSLSGKTWGSLVADFISRKWNCLSAILKYLRKDDQNAMQNLDIQNLYETAVDELESASEDCVIAIMHCIHLLLQTPFDVSLEMIQSCVDYSLEMINASFTQSNTFPKIVSAAIDMIFQKSLLANSALNEDDGPIKKAFHKILEWGEVKPAIVAQMAAHYYDYWSEDVTEKVASLEQYKSEYIQLLIYGPVRDRDDQKIDGALLLKSTAMEEVTEAEGTAELSFSANDYVTRVQMNIILLTLDEKIDAHRRFATSVLDELLTLSSSEKYTHKFLYVNQIEHRWKLRMWCSIMLMLRFVAEEDAGHYLNRIHECIKVENMVSIRSYMEWAAVLLYARFLNQLSSLYEKLQDTNPKAHYMISMVTITMFLGQTLDATKLPEYLSEMLPYLLPWLTSNHHTIRLIAQCSLRKNWLRLKSLSGPNPLTLNGQEAAMETLCSFLETNADAVRFRGKLEESYFYGHFHPNLDYDIDFIFRQMPTIFNVAESERIGSRAFLKVNAKEHKSCPLINLSRNRIKPSAGTIEDLLEREATSVQESTDASYQKKIMPWEMMLHSDIDLTKSLVQHHRRRNDLIVVGSLIDRLPNLAGLCRTCEIFNASLLTVHSLKIKDDPNFLGISVASEKWMPMKEVPETDVLTFLKEKKQEGYVVCGLEQTTNSTPLQDFEFPTKCVLLLGKETQGIPAHLLQILDHAIEIPQFGITRSLNVHVSASICIYEYTKRQLMG